mmetsp:Transcript_25929/g.75550  ORF Transcript_25929/g.75550 Transcript_25929/m.75550 type:complete len:218 (+) Transcript_25929:1068-1721(+)
MPKGDGSICYAKPESVALAIQVLDGGRLRGDVVLKVSEAKFELKGEQFDPTKRRKVSEAAKKVAKAATEQALAWNEDDDSGLLAQTKGKGGLKIVVIERMFVPSDFDDPKFEEELQEELVTELEAKVGEPEKLTLFPKNPRGVVIAKFKTAFAAEECIKLMHGRFFAERKLVCYYWDGATDYTVRADDAEEEKRIEKFGDWIEEQELPEELQLQVEE